MERKSLPKLVNVMHEKATDMDIKAFEAVVKFYSRRFQKKNVLISIEPLQRKCMIFQSCKSVAPNMSLLPPFQIIPRSFATKAFFWVQLACLRDKSCYF